MQLIPAVIIQEFQVHSLSSMRQARDYTTLVALESQAKIYAIGGFEGGLWGAQSLATVEVYDVETNQWSAANPMVPADISLSRF